MSWTAFGDIQAAGEWGGGQRGEGGQQEGGMGMVRETVVEGERVRGQEKSGVGGHGAAKLLCSLNSDFPLNL